MGGEGKMHQRSVLVCRHWYGSFGCRICYWSVTSLSWTGRVDASQKLGVRREHDVQAMDGWSRSASASSIGLAGPALRGIAQQFALVDRFDLSPTPTLHDRGPSLKSSPYTPHRSGCHGFQFRTDAFSVHAHSVRLSAEVALGWAASFSSHASFPPAPYLVMTALLLPDDQPHNHFPSHSTQCHAFIHASLYICSGRFLVSLILPHTRDACPPLVHISLIFHSRYRPPGCVV